MLFRSALAVTLSVLPLLLGLTPHLEARYLLPCTPAIALLTGLGAARLAQRPLSLGALLALVLVVATIAPRRGVPRAALGNTSWSVYPTLLQLLQRLQRETATDLPDLASKTVWVDLDHQGVPLEWRAWPPVDHLLLEPYRPFQGSGAPPCLLMLQRAEDGPPFPQHVDERWISSALGLHDGSVGGGVLKTLDPRRALVTWTRTRGRCPTSMVDRYLDTPQERALRATMPLPCGSSRRLDPSGHSAARWAATLCHPAGSLDPLPVLVEVEVTPTRLGVTLHANALRGLSDNGGWLASRILERPRLVLHQGASTVELLIEPGYVGFMGALTPLSAAGEVPPGPWTVVLQGGLVEPGRGFPPDPLVVQEVAVLLGDIDVPSASP